MSGAVYCKGDRISISHTGTVVASDVLGLDYVTDKGDHHSVRFCSATEIRMVERAHQVGDLVIDREGDVCELLRSGRWNIVAGPSQGMQVDNDEIVYPIRKIGRVSE